MSLKTSQQTQVKHIQWQSPSTSQTREFIDCAPEYTSVFFTSPTEVQAEAVHQIQTHSKTRSLEIIHKLTAKTLPVCKLPKHDHTQKSSNPHIRPLWISWSQKSPVQQIECEVNTGTGCNVSTSLQSWSLIWTRMTKLPPMMVYIKLYGGKPVHSLGPCIAYMHNGHKIYRVLCQVTDTKGYFILGREQDQEIYYIQYLQIQPPTCTFTPETSLKAIVVESDKRSSS